MGRKSYDEGFENLQEAFEGMAETSIERVEWGVEAVRARDGDLAHRIITSDDEVDDLYIEVERRCTDLLALHQPVAGDLRYVTAVFKISTDLERIADLAVNLGEYTLRGGSTKIVEEVDVASLGDYALEMFREAIDAFRDGDIDRAVTVIQRDDEMDRRCEEMNNLLIDRLMRTEFGERGQEVAATVSTVLLAIRDLERMADHAVNISARTVYMVSSDRRFI
ncbi:MAG: hypothetical protein MAG715_00655 [Methanonatronarchaeales archaeon]|nr:hypothetical protein [Methanonatronarchaeales archaeon]